MARTPSACISVCDLVGGFYFFSDDNAVNGTGNQENLLNLILHSNKLLI